MTKGRKRMSTPMVQQISVFEENIVLKSKLSEQGTWIAKAKELLKMYDGLNDGGLSLIIDSLVDAILKVNKINPSDSSAKLLFTAKLQKELDEFVSEYLYTHTQNGSLTV